MRRNNLEIAFGALAVFSFVSFIILGFSGSPSPAYAGFVSGMIWLFLAGATEADARRTSSELDQIKQRLAELEKKSASTDRPS